MTGQTLSEAFTYTVRDAAGLTDTAQLTITIDGRNDAPVGVDDAGSAIEAGGSANGTAGSNATGNVLSNDTDVDSAGNGETKAVSAVRTGTEAGSGTAGTVGSSLTGTFGSLTLNADGTYTYVVDNNNAAVQALRVTGQTVSESFTYTVRDAAGLTDTAQLTITIDGRNDAPIAVDDTGSAVEAGGTANGTAGSNATGNVLTNDTDVDSVGNGETKTVSAVRTGLEAGSGTAGTIGSALVGTYGSLTLNANGTYTYVIDETNVTVQALRVTGQTVNESFTYTVRDTAGLTDTAQLTITIDGRNDAPVGVDDTGNAVEAGGVANGSAGSNATGNVLTNDTDVDAGDTKAVSAVRTGTEAGSGTAGTVGSSLTGAYGSLTLNADGTYTYVVDNNNAAVQALRVSGQTISDNFTYTVRDTAGLTDTAQLTIAIDGRNDAPIGVDDSGTAVEAGGVANGTAGSNSTGNVLTNDTDVDTAGNGETKTVTTIRTGSEAGSGTAGTVGSSLTGTFGSLTLNANGTYTYVVDDNNATVQALKVGQSVNEAFTYTVRDAAGLTDTAQLTIAINGANDAPVANPDTNFVVDGGAAATGNVLTSAAHTASYADQADTDIEGDTLTVAKVNGNAGNVGVAVAVTYGTVTLSANGSYSYTPDSANAAVQALSPGQSLTETVNYQISDGHGGTATSTLKFTVFGANNEPVGANKTITTNEDTPYALAAGDFGFTDVDTTSPAGDFAAVRIDTLPATGTLTLNGVAVTAGQIVSKALLDAGKLSYASPHNLAGNGLASFNFSVEDGLNAFDTSSRTITFNVTQVSDAPSIVTATADATSSQPAQPIPLSISVALTDTNGPAPETLSQVTISGFPGGAQLSNTAGDVLTITGGSVTMTVAQLSGLKVKLPITQQQDFTLQVSATSTDGAAAPAQTVAPLLVKVPSTPPINGNATNDLMGPPGYRGERIEQLIFGTYPPVLGGVMSTDLHVQLAVRESADAIEDAANRIDGLGVAPGDEISSDSLKIGQGMRHTDHVSRDGVFFSQRLTNSGQSRARGMGNSLIIGAETLFNDFAPFDGRNEPAPAEQSSAESDGTVNGQRDNVALPPVAQQDDVEVNPLPVTDMPRGAVAFTRQLAAVAAERQLVREGRAAVPALRVARATLPG